MRGIFWRASWNSLLAMADSRNFQIQPSWLRLQDRKDVRIARAPARGQAGAWPLPGRTFLGAAALSAIMYAAFKSIEPGMNIGVDLGEEWGSSLPAEQLRSSFQKQLLKHGTWAQQQAAFLWV